MIDINFVDGLVKGGIVIGGSLCCISWFVGYGLHGLLSTFKHIAK
ncbi:hypothetical protein [Clostridium botulinum]|nr:hypothetical protein [Clostridium botulinum]